MNRLTWRKTVNAVMSLATALCALVAVVPLLFVLGLLVVKGASSLNLAFFTKLPVPVGETGGGIANAIVGSGQLLLLAAVFGVPLGVLGGIYLSEFGGWGVPFLVRYAADLLVTVPSIVIGIFAYAVVVLPVGHFSALAGGFALGVMLLPIVVTNTEQFLRTVPVWLREGSLALGAGHWKTIVSVVVPTALQGILTGILLALARVAGETAPLIFTAFNNAYWNRGWNQPISSLPYMIWIYGISAYDDWHRMAWAAALVLLALVLLVNVLARLVLARRMATRRAV
ncbi:MAG TPA: phosphate ABC transporter permease PstA [Terriglobia bacterium]|nr:phosphate ABC transporter permease PstA [Terriglobia bacterium]